MVQMIAQDAGARPKGAAPSCWRGETDSTSRVHSDTAVCLQEPTKNPPSSRHSVDTGAHADLVLLPRNSRESGSRSSPCPLPRHAAHFLAGNAADYWIEVLTAAEAAAAASCTRPVGQRGPFMGPMLGWRCSGGSARRRTRPVESSEARAPPPSWDPACGQGVACQLQFGGPPGLQPAA